MNLRKIKMLVIASSGLLFSTLIYSKVTDFSVVQIGDTQGFLAPPYYNGQGDMGDPNSERCVSQTQISDMLDYIFETASDINYKYVVMVGDIVGNPGHVSNGQQSISQSEENMWKRAYAGFESLPTQNSNRKIGYGFATGNHDLLWVPGQDANPKYSTKNTFYRANLFLETIYENSPVPNLFIATEQHPEHQYILSVGSFTVDKLKFKVLNLPYGINTQANDWQKIVNYVNSNQDILFIINMHTLTGFGYSGNATEQVKKLRNVFMVLYGHTEQTLNNDTTFIPMQAVGENGSHYITRPDMPPIYVYMFDYQDRWGGKSQCGPAGNLPQHPLFRRYNFSFDNDSSILSWTAEDIQAWTGNPIYQKKIGWAQGVKIPTQADKPLPYPRPNGKKWSINVNDYISNTPSGQCQIESINCSYSVDIGSQMTWKMKDNKKASYEILDYKNAPLTKTYNAKYADESAKNNASPNNMYTYSIIAKCNDPNGSEDRKSICIEGIPGACKNAPPQYVLCTQ